MSILFKCPCGRSMVVESDRAGAVVQCPNCKRSLKVPSGKDRGVELPPVPAAAKGRASRKCPRCQKEIPVDAQMCPHCKAIIMEDAPGAGAPAAGASSRPAAASARPGARPPGSPSAIRYGGHSGSWWETSTGQQKGMVLGGIGGGFVLLMIIALLIYVVYGNAVVRDERASGQEALDQGRQLELLGDFQGAHDLYAVTSRIDALRSSGKPEDAQLADALVRRMNAMAYLAPSTQIAAGESIYWKPRDAADLERERANLQANYSNYRNLTLGITKTIIDATKTAMATPTPDKAAYQAKVQQAIEAYVNLVGPTPRNPQHATITFQQLLESLRNFSNAYKDWDKPERARLLKSAFMYADACRERVEMTDPFGDNFWGR